MGTTWLQGLNLCPIEHALRPTHVLKDFDLVHLEYSSTIGESIARANSFASGFQNIEAAQVPPGARESAECRVFALRVAHPGSIHILYGPRSASRSNF